MEVDRLEDVPFLDAVIEMQRTLSASNNQEELVIEFLQRFHRMSGQTELLYIHIVDAVKGIYQIMSQMHTDPDSLNLDNFRKNTYWDKERDQIPLRTGGLIGQLISDTSPRVLKNVTPDDDPVLQGWLTENRDVILVPIYFDGECSEIIFVFRPAGSEIIPEQMRVLVAILNMFSRMVFQVNLIDEITQLHDQLSAQLEEVAEVQRSILPASLPEHPNIDMDVFYRPSDYAGGDYYDFREFDDGSIGMVMADVAGHGPAAAIVMAMMRTAMSVHNSLNLGGEKISQIINSFLQDGLRNGTFVTAFFFRLNTETGAVAYSNAGHSPAIRINKAGEISELDAPGNPPLGILPEITPKGAQLQLEPGDTILLYTDGISEVFNANNEQFGVDRLKESLKNNRGNAKKTIQGITHDMDAFRGSHAIRDDQCMLSIVWK